MSLVSGPGRGGASSGLPDEIQLAVEAHVKYIQSLDTVRFIIDDEMLSNLSG
jgi:geranylgeranyl transferase type-2 subunit beta